MEKKLNDIAQPLLLTVLAYIGAYMVLEMRNVRNLVVVAVITGLIGVYLQVY